MMPGFYGGMPDGAVATFSRGGSDISGAVLARASGSECTKTGPMCPAFWLQTPGSSPRLPHRNHDLC